MSGLLNIIKSKVFDDSQAKMYNGIQIAEVVNYDNLTNTASILINDLLSDGTYVKNDVPVKIQSYGFHTPALKEGDKVWIAFTNNSPLLPKIIGLVDKDFSTDISKSNLNHALSGGLNVCSEETINNCTNMINDLIDNDNEDLLKYHQYKIFDLENYACNIIASLGYYDSNDIGLTNPNTGSTIKIDKEGCISIYINEEQGIKINPTTSSIDISCNGTLNINCKNIKINGSYIERNDNNGL